MKGSYAAFSKINAIYPRKVRLQEPVKVVLGSHEPVERDGHELGELVVLVRQQVFDE